MSFIDRFRREEKGRGHDDELDDDNSSNDFRWRNTTTGANAERKRDKKARVQPVVKQSTEDALLRFELFRFFMWIMPTVRASHYIH